MPVEIKELIIKATVSETQPAAGTAKRPGATTATDPALRRDQILAACLEQTIELLQQKKER